MGLGAVQRRLVLNHQSIGVPLDSTCCGRIRTSPVLSTETLRIATGAPLPFVRFPVQATDRGTTTGSSPADGAVTRISTDPTGRTTARARPSKVRQVAASKLSSVLGFALHIPARTPAPLA